MNTASLEHRTAAVSGFVESLQEPLGRHISRPSAFLPRSAFRSLAWRVSPACIATPCAIPRPSVCRTSCAKWFG